MKKGDVVMIYEDPITCKKVEGKARIITKRSERNNLETWNVRFVGERETFFRTIKKAPL